MRAWARRLRPPLSKLDQQIVRFPPRTMARCRQQVPVIEALFASLRFLGTDCIAQCRVLCPIGHCLLVKIAHRMTPSPITVIEMTVRNVEYPLLFGQSYNFCAIHEVFFFPHPSHSPASADVF